MHTRSACLRRDGGGNWCCAMSGYAPVRAGPPGGGACWSLSVNVYVVGLDANDEALFARLAEGIAVLIEILLGERVDVLVRALARALADAATDHDVLVGVLEVLHRDRHARGAFEVARPGAALGGIEHRSAVLH